MVTVYGIIEMPLMDEGSKSEGPRAVLTDDEGKRYFLYRAGTLSSDDPFFKDYVGMRVGVVGEDEPDTGNFCVNKIILEDGTEVGLPAEALSANIPFNIPDSCEEENKE